MSSVKVFFISLVFFLPILFYGAPAQGSQWVRPVQSLTKMEGFYFFEGDNKGDFKGDLVAVLADGSAWKGHPSDTEVLSQWKIGDCIHVQVRTSFYWFKREHKFLLYNHDKNESVKVMLVNYGDVFLEISDTSGVYPTNTEIVSFWYYDMEGNQISDWHIEPCDYRKLLLFNDGSKCLIGDNFQHFKPGMNVYFGFNENRNKSKLFLISGIGREAKWTWIQDQ